ncbi:isopropylmalate isomerase [Sphingomonas sp. NSE70-1]|uniref:Isopropylmalate isomerase n=1 Tax=Sphingomonas caseinilyticus TaxID=2908205 RepID=A0ABT0RS05_9SPHN|nr:isopropylmalate isomerase [Sphingomonas caseinilyticus]MCL6697613.1 isopropylmalate isomerase [Sphingomonas caseinilyticus]
MSNSDKSDEERRAKLVKAGVAVGIGSAAIVAALLYASTVRKKAKRTPPSGDATD